MEFNSSSISRRVSMSADILWGFWPLCVSRMKFTIFLFKLICRYFGETVNAQDAELVHSFCDNMCDVCMCPSSRLLVFSNHRHVCHKHGNCRCIGFQRHCRCVCSPCPWLSTMPAKITSSFAPGPTIGGLTCCSFRWHCGGLREWQVGYSSSS